jgi:type IV fimbrial biogenesis protein FimT
MKNTGKFATGFTLIELMVSVSLAVILLAVAVPSVTTFMRNSQLTSFTNALLSGINAARSEAMKRGRYAMVVPADGSSWDSGWIVFVDVDRNSSYSATSDITILTSEPKPPYLTITAIAVDGTTPPPPILYIMYDASGYSRRTLTGAFGASTFEIKRNDVTGAELLSQTRRLKIASTGRARVCTPKSDPDDTCDLVLP